jgi:hypothetical protein
MPSIDFVEETALDFQPEASSQIDFQPEPEKPWYEGMSDEEYKSELTRRRRAIYKDYLKQRQQDIAESQPSVLAQLPEAYTEELEKPRLPEFIPKIAKFAELAIPGTVPEPKPGSIQAGVEQLGRQTAETLTTPANVLALGASVLAPEVVGPYFAKQAIEDVGTATGELIEAESPQQIVASGGRGILDLALTGSILKGGARELRARFPRSATELDRMAFERPPIPFPKEEEPSGALPASPESIAPEQPKEPSAVPEQPAKEILQTLRTQPIEGEGQVPAETGVARILGVEQAKEAAEVPLTEGGETIEKTQTQRQEEGQLLVPPIEPGAAQESLPSTERTMPVLVSAFRRDNTIRLEFDASKGPINAEQVKAAFEGPDRSVEVIAFQPNEFSTAQGRANFSVIVGTPEGPYSTELAKKAYREILGTDEDITGKSAIESRLPFEERFSQSIRSEVRRETGMEPGAAAEPTAPVVAETKVQSEVSKVAETEGKRSAKDIKDELVNRIQGELNKVVEESGVKVEANPEYGNYSITDSEGKWLGNAVMDKLESGSYSVKQRGKPAFTAKSIDDGIRMLKERNASAPGKVTIEIPGDGVFTVLRNGPGMSQLLTRAQRIKTDAGKPSGPSAAQIKSSASVLEKQARDVTGTPINEGGPPSPTALGIVPPGWNSLANTFVQFSKAITRILAPANVDAAAGQTGRIIRANVSQMYREHIQAREALKQAKAQFDKQSNPQNLDFIDRMESGRPQTTPQLNAISQQLRDAFADRVRQVRALGTGKLQTLIENYFPHIWQDPQSAISWYQRIFGKRPLEGPKAFLKQRTIPTTADGVAAGLKPVSYNPVELTLLKLHEMDRYIMAHKVLNEMKDVGLAKFFKFAERRPEGWGKIDDRISQVIQMRPTPAGPTEAILRGNYYAPEEAARVLNNYLSPGLRGNILFDTLRAAGNNLNMAQLGLSAYHLTFTGIDSAVSKAALGAEQISRSRGSPLAVARGLTNIAKGTIGNAALYAPIENFFKGSKVLKEYTKPGSVGGIYTDIVNKLIAGGGRVEMDTFYKNSAAESFWKSFKEGDYPKAMWKLPWALLQYASKPIMELWVPRMKLGVMFDLAKMEMERLPPDAPIDKVREVMGKAWDSVDNRMGQMVYDNLFWNKTLKDLSMVAVRSVGWNLGTLRELGGGLVDTTTIMKRIRNGDPILTHRMSYTIFLPIVVGTLGAMYQYAATGKGPETLQDYFLPKNGRKRADGSDERVILPSYMKDVMPLVKAGKEGGTWGVVGRLERMAINKSNPQIALIADMLMNRDFYGRPIANPEDPLVKQVEAYAKFVRDQFKPFSFRAIEKQGEKSVGAKTASFFGLQPAPSELDPTAVGEIQRKARQFMQRQGRAPAQSPISDYHDLRLALIAGDDAKSKEELRRLRMTRSDRVIIEAFRRNLTHPFTGSLVNEIRFRNTLKPNELKTYQATQQERMELFKQFVRVWQEAVKEQPSKERQEPIDFREE